jgi:hypothetical protein
MDMFMDFRKYTLALLLMIFSSLTFAGQAEIQTSFTTLTSYHSGCTSSTAYSAECRAAVHRYCAATGYVSGYGPVEYAGSTAVVVCLDNQSVVARNSTFAQVTAQDSGCTISAINSANCRNAVDLLCAAAGYGNGGFGPLEYTSSGVVYACATGAGKKRLNARYTQLSSEFAGCSNAAFTSQSCITAAHRYCKSKMYLSGFPVYKKYSDYATLTCVEYASPTLKEDSRFSAANISTINWALQSNVAVGSDGCNAVRYAQLPDNENVFIGRMLNNTVPSDGCSGSSWKLTVSEFNKTTNQFTRIYDLLQTPATVLNGTHSLTTAYDPSVMLFNGQYWVAFECHGTNLSGSVNKFGTSVAACVAPVGVFGVLDTSRLSIAISGGSYISGDQYTHSASVPKLLVHQNRIYLYWSDVKIRKSDGAWQNIVGRGTELEYSNGMFYAKGYREPMVSNNPDGVIVWNTSANASSVADAADIKSDGRWIYATGSLGGQGCLTPLNTTQGCYRIAIAKTRLPLDENTFGSNVINDTMVNDSAEYPSFMYKDGKLSLLAQFTNSTNPSRLFNPGMRLIELSALTTAPQSVTANCQSSQPSPNWGMSRGSCLASCGGIGGTVAHDYKTCKELGLKSYGAAYDVEFCCGNP